MIYRRFLLSILLLSLVQLASAKSTYQINQLTADGTATPIGTVTGENSKYGLMLTPALNSLPPGIHGFHVHEHATCEHDGMTAGGHYDPAKTDKHLGPYNAKGHLGDLPALYVDQTGNATLPVVAPRLKEADLKDHALMIHEGGDNYSDNPKLGGGGKRIACGIASSN